MSVRKAITVIELINEFVLALHSVFSRWDEMRIPKRDTSAHT
jgi:hypothetical protein